MSERCEDVTIGIPVYNEERFVAQAIESAVNQAGTIILADNASTDGTSDICKGYADKHPHIFYVRHPTNMGALANFCYCLDNALTPYFIWIGSHDYLAENAISILVSAMKSTKESTLAYGYTAMIQENGAIIRIEKSDNSRVCSKSATERVLAVIDSIDCVSVYGLHKTEMLKQFVFRNPVYGPDKITLARLASAGPFVHAQRVLSYQRVLNRRNQMCDYTRRLVAESGIKLNARTMYQHLLGIAINANSVSKVRKLKETARAIQALRKLSNPKTISYADIARAILRIYMFR